MRPLQTRPRLSRPLVYPCGVQIAKVIPVLLAATVASWATGLSFANPAWAQQTPPLGTQLAELEGSGTAQCDWFGGNVAISGNTIVAGAYGYGADPSCEGMFPGGAFVFTKTATGWKQTAVLQPSDKDVDDWFGIPVAISGSTIAVGAENKGRTYVFDKTAKGWQQTAELKGGLAGISGNTLVVDSGNNAYVFTTMGDSWRQTGELKNTSIGAISGSTMVTMGDMNVGEEQGLHVFTKTTKGWQDSGELKGSDGSWAFGGSVGISGSTIVVGDSQADSGAGAAYVFTKTAAGWVQTAELVGSDTVAKDLFGWVVTISGSTIVVGAPWHGSKAGRAYVFTNTASGWTQTAELKGSDTVAGDTAVSEVSGDIFGISDAISKNTIVVGGSGHDDGTGRAYVFQG